MRSSDGGHHEAFINDIPHFHISQTDTIDSMELNVDAAAAEFTSSSGQRKKQGNKILVHKQVLGQLVRTTNHRSALINN